MACPETSCSRPVDEAQILWLLQESQQYKVTSCRSSDEVEVLLVSRD